MMERLYQQKIENEKRLLFLYLLSKVGSFVSREKLAPVFTQTGDDWLSVQLRLSRLIDDGLVLEDGSKIFLSAEGKRVLDVYIDEISKDEKEKMDHYLAKHKEELIDNVHIHAGFEKQDSGYLVKLSIGEGGRILLKLELEAATREIAAGITKNFKKNPETLYSGIIEIISQSEG